MLFTHDEFLNKLYYEDCISWLMLLMSCIERSNGALIGFSDTSDEKNDRESELLPSMKWWLLQILDRIVKKPLEDEKKEKPDDLHMEKTIIITAIEFCLQLHAYEFLFEEVQDFFY